MEAAEWKKFISKGADVSLKVNLGWDLFLPGAVTSPWVVEGVIQAIKGYVGQIYIVESDQVLVNSEKALRQTRIDRVCKKNGVPYVNMSKGTFERVHLNHGLLLTDIDVPEILRRTELITIPVMKTHDKTTITGAIKNQWGCLDKFRHNYHMVVNEVLVDINTVIRPCFAILDATVGLEGNSPKSGRPKVVDLVLASGDIVALDTIQAEIMGFDSRGIRHIQNCAKHGLGVTDLAQIQVVGEDYRQLNFNFAPAKHNFVSLVELALRNSPLRPLAFYTPLFSIFCAGAIVWYLIWYYLGKGHRLRDEILTHPRYGPQWRADHWKKERDAEN